MDRRELVRAELHYIIMGDIYCTLVSHIRARHCQIETFGALPISEPPELRFPGRNMAEAPVHGAGCVLRQARHFANGVSRPYDVDIVFCAI